MLRFRQPGHISFICPHSSGSVRNAIGLLQIQVGFALSDKLKPIPFNWILFDICSTVSVGDKLNLFDPVQDRLEEEIVLMLTIC